MAPDMRFSVLSASEPPLSVKVHAASTCSVWTFKLPAAAEKVTAPKTVPRRAKSKRAANPTSRDRNSPRANRP